MKLPRWSPALLVPALLTCDPALVKPPPGVGLGGSGGYAGAGGSVTGVAGTGGGGYAGTGGYAGAPGRDAPGGLDAAAGAGGRPPAPRPPDAAAARPDRPQRPDTPPPVPLLYVTGTGMNANFATDADIVDHLLDRGFDVNTRSDSQVIERDIRDADAIVLSASTDSATVLMTMRDVATLDKPIIAMDENLEQPLNLVAAAGDRATINETQVQIAADADPKLTAGLTGTVKVYAMTTGLGVGVPGPGALKIATVNGGPANQFAIYAYPKGAAMANNVMAPSKRVFFFVRESAQRDLLTPEALKLLDAAVDFALAP
jgi:hypothetical protein